jgi:hypothetical protein
MSNRGMEKGFVNTESYVKIRKRSLSLDLGKLRFSLSISSLCMSYNSKLSWLMLRA